MINEEELILQCIKGNRQAQEWLYQEHKNQLMGICRRYCSSKEQAQDVLQDSFVKIFTNINKFNNSGKLIGWMSRIVINTAIKNSKKWEYKKINDEIENYDTQVHVEYLSNLSLKELLELVEKLPEGCKLVFNLFVIDEYTHLEISELLNISVGTSKSQLSRAKSLLCQQIIKIKEYEHKKINSLK